MKDLSGFYSVVAGINFTLLGLWWVAVQERPDLRSRRARTSRMAYVVSLQFVLPGTAALLSQVAPTVPIVWRASFVAAGIAGGAGILLLAPALGRAQARTAARWLLVLGVPLYVLVVIVASVPQLSYQVDNQLNGAQLEAVLFCLLLLLGAQTAWTAAMAPQLTEEPERAH